ncbi:Arginine biosynthesis bifunctional protein ArgJ [Rosistilla oblonga]|uniref:bifunctional glutamate N-acetyltransferase/amino-acid acetyltransferase ArgJ n=1 Tax=Rosistilla oblonga TaxID=2527990 RepID=UPI001188E488|nr:bifunctional glutamate N-acetyltransferase/amino-acid acetyltransferase ArgJ [Rosistilla oblonga]QDV13687.1 Arginine biosynthesis bifunctional protein ArgJ [Rosistilla oblonga]
MQLPQGFRFAGVRCGIKAKADRKDLTLVVGDRDLVAAGVYTQNKIVAAPVVLSRSRTPSSAVRAVVINSGNANACTGQQGDRDALAMTNLVAKACELDPSSVLVMSTGIIGHKLPMDRIEQGIQSAAEQLNDSSDNFLAAADGILTTDQGRKLAFRCEQIGDQKITFAAMAKGAGMIGPNMATMLGLVLCDANLSKIDAQRALRVAADASFNSISVDGHTSTNDTVNLLCSGTASATPLAEEHLARFTEVLTDFCIELAKQIPADGEGAHHVIEIRVGGADCDADAKQIAKSIADSPLVKTAVTGNDPNWGRIMSAAGYAGVLVRPELCQLKINGSMVFDKGQPIDFDEKAISESMAADKTVVLEVTVGDGPGTSVFWTSDLTTDYVTFNSDYST